MISNDGDLQKEIPMTTSKFFSTDPSQPMSLSKMIWMIISIMKVCDGQHIFSYDYGGDYGGFFGSGFPSLFGAPRVRVVVVPVDEVLTYADNAGNADNGDHGVQLLRSGRA